MRKYLRKNLSPDFTMDFEFYYAEEISKLKKTKKVCKIMDFT